MWVLWRGHIETAEFLVSKRADLEVVDNAVVTALMLAFGGGHIRQNPSLNYSESGLNLQTTAESTLHRLL